MISNGTELRAVAAIRTEHLLLREFTDADVDPLYAIQGDRQHMKFTSWAESREVCERRLRLYAGSRQAYGYAPWTALLADETVVVGWGGLKLDLIAPQWGVEVSYFIHQSYASRGFATELVRASLKHGFDDLVLERIGAFARPQNPASVRVLEKCGFRFLRYEPALERNHYEVRRGEWAVARLRRQPTSRQTPACSPPTK